jgi:hypothetical protein
MSRKKWLLIGVVGFAICICAIPIALLAIYFFRPSFLDPFTTVYAYEVVPSTHEGYSRHTLTMGNTTYESDYPEYTLSLAGGDNSQLIGQTPLGGRIYGIPGQDPSVYVVMYDFMSPVGIFRKSQYPIFDWHTATFRKMRLYPLGAGTNTTGAYKGSTDAQLIQNVLATLKGRTAISPSQVTGSTSNYALYLYSNQLPGMNFCAGVYMDGDGRVYLAENTISREWFPASQPFYEWARSP